MTTTRSLQHSVSFTLPVGGDMYATFPFGSVQEDFNFKLAVGATEITVKKDGALAGVDLPFNPMSPWAGEVQIRGMHYLQVAIIPIGEYAFVSVALTK